MSNPPNSSAQQAPEAIVLASGGLDSTTVLAMASEQGFRPFSLTLNYGQAHAIEIERAASLASRYATAGHLRLDLPLASIGGSALLGDGTAVPDEPAAGAGSSGIPSTYVPARNMIFLSLAVSLAEARGVRDIFIGVNALDYSGYPDCRPEFVTSFEGTANLGTRDGVESDEPWFRIHTPLLHLTKAEIITRGVALGVDYGATISCYRPDDRGAACGTCDSCGLRRRGFEEAGVQDPTIYQ